MDDYGALRDKEKADMKEEIRLLKIESEGRLHGSGTMIDVFLSLNDGFVSFNYDEKYGHVHCDTTNPTAALAKAFQYCIEAMTEPHDIIVVHQEDLREEE